MDEQGLERTEQRLADEIRALADAMEAREMTEAHRAYLEQRLAVAEGLRLTVTQQEQALHDLRNQLERSRTANDRLEQQLEHCRRVEREGRRELQQASARIEELHDELARIHASGSFALARLLASPLRALRAVARRVARRIDSWRGGDAQQRPATEVASDATGNEADDGASGGQAPEDTPEGATTPASDEPSTTSDRERVLLDARGVAGADLAAVLDDVGDLADGRLVVVIDTLDFTAVRRRGVPFEYIPDAAMVAARYGEDAAQRVRDERWQEILDAHTPTELIRAVHTASGVVETRRTTL